MRTRALAGWTAALALLVLVAAAVGADAQRPADTGPHLLSVATQGPPAAALARTDAQVIARYGAFSLVRASGPDADRLRRAGADVRDDMHKVRLGRTEVDPASDRSQLAVGRRSPEANGLALVQFVGPIKPAWLDRLRATGVRVVTYMAENGYLVSGSFDELGAVSALEGSDPAVRAVVEVGAADKLGAGVKQEGRQRLAVQTLSGDVGSRARAQVAARGRKVQDTSAVGPFRTQYTELDAAEAAALAADPGVVSIQPAPEPKLLDERADQIVAGALSGPDPLVPTGPGYLSFYSGLGLGTSLFPFVVDVTDEGIDVGSTSTDQADFHVDGNVSNPSRIAYADDFTADPDARDCGGHGTINASIAGGYNSGSGATVEDAAGYNYGLGVAPYAQLGASKLFLCAGSFGLNTTLTALATNAYNKGTRITNHSWGSANGGAYNSDSQSLDAIVRDADPGTTGNQQMVEVVSAGNSGSGTNTSASLANAKNVIAVGAAESPRASGTDGCGVTDASSDDAHDIVNFSSRGPTDDGRLKPDVVGPGTHITGSQSHATGYNGSGVCNPQFPSGSLLYNLSSGTSHSAPVVTGAAALFREWYRQKKGGGTAVPSPALTKAAVAQSATNLEGGVGVSGAEPNNDQGWGLVNFQRLFDTGPRFFSDQETLFTASGQSSHRTFDIADSSKPVRVTLDWTDPPGPTVGNSYINNLDLVVGAATGTYKGNVFAGGVSTTGGAADPRNNLESVYLPAGTSGQISVTVNATNIAGDGVPGNGSALDQDFALVVSNANEVTTPVLTAGDTTVAAIGGDGDAVVEPGERFSVSQQVANTGTASGTGIAGQLSAPGPVTVTDGATAWPDLAPDDESGNSGPLTGRIDPSATCGATTTMTLDITSDQGATASIPVKVTTGETGSAVSFDSTDVPKAIPDNNATGVTSNLNVPDAGAIADVNVRIGSITHTWDGDLRIEVRSPANTVVVLANRPGGSGNSGDNFTNTVFDDEAATALSSGTAPYTGSFRPEGGTPGSDHLSAFDGQDQQGTWTLKVSDNANADTGTLQSWGLDAAGEVCDFVPPAAPAQPTGLTATPAAGAVAVDWDDTPSATSYEIYRRTSGGSYPASPLGTSTSSEFNDPDAAGHGYCYKVGALNDASPGPLSSESCEDTSGGGGGPGGGGQPGGGQPGGQQPGGEQPGGQQPGAVTVDLSSLSKSLKVNRKGVFTASFAGTPAKTGSIVLTTVKAVAARKRKLVVARKAFTVPATGKVKLKLKLTRKGMKVLKAKKRLPVSAKVALATTTATKRVTLRAPRHRR